MSRRLVNRTLAALRPESVFATVFTAPDGTSSGASYLNPNTGRFWTMDSHEGTLSDPLSLHKYLYVQGNPVMNTDPSGHESVGSLTTSLSILGGFFAQASIPATAAGTAAAGTTCGPDVTAAVLATARHVAETFMADKHRGCMAAFRAYPPSNSYRDFDVHKLHDVGERDSTIDFGNGSRLGTGPIGLETVQFRSGENMGLNVYYAGSVNYFLWGYMFRLAYETCRHPLLGYRDPWFSEDAAVRLARLHKFRIGAFGTDYEKQAVAFVKWGHSVGSTDPSNTALKTIKTNPGNVASTERFKWKWRGLHDTLQ